MLWLDRIGLIATRVVLLVLVGGRHCEPSLDRQDLGQNSLLDLSEPTAADVVLQTEDGRHHGCEKDSNLHLGCP